MDLKTLDKANKLKSKIYKIDENIQRLNDYIYGKRKHTKFSLEIFKKNELKGNFDIRVTADCISYPTMDDCDAEDILALNKSLEDKRVRLTNEFTNLGEK